MNIIRQRENIVKAIYEKRRALETLFEEIENVSEENMVQYSKVVASLQESEKEYLSLLPNVLLSRSPLTKELYSLSIDDFGLDGPWWDAERPIRGTEDEIQGFFALTGSVNILGEIPNVPFSLKPGPAVPWVCSRILQDERISAVMSHMKIGEYDAYITVYYTNDTSIDIERINTWGTDVYIAEDADGYAVTGSTFDLEEEYDFDISPWIKKGKLKWIAVDDAELILRDTVEDCPYINIEGYRYPVLIENKTMKNCMIKLEYEEEEATKNNYGFCTNCGKPLPEGAKFCPYCGAKVIDTKGDKL